MTPAQRAMAALKDTHLFWGPALELDDDDGTGKPQAWRDSDHNLQAMAQDALDFCDELRDQESRGEEAVEGQGQGRKRRKGDRPGRGGGHGRLQQALAVRGPGHIGPAMPQKLFNRG
jgi:hypothetical protein